MTEADLFKFVWKFKKLGGKLAPNYRSKEGREAPLPKLVEACDGILTRSQEEAKRPAGRDARIPVKWPTWEEMQRRPLEQPAESASPAGAASSDAFPGSRDPRPGKGCGSGAPIAAAGALAWAILASRPEDADASSLWMASLPAVPILTYLSWATTLRLAWDVTTVVS